MIATMILGFLVAWVPYAIVAMIKVFSTISGQSDLPFDATSIYVYLPALLAKSSIVYNPIIYAVFNTQVMIEFKSSRFGSIQSFPDAQHTPRSSQLETKIFVQPSKNKV